MITIVIPTKNDCYNLKRLFKSLDNIANEIEVIVVDDLSDDGTKELVSTRKYAKIIEKKSTPGEARNIGISKAKHKTIAMLDADTEITASWLPSLEHGIIHFPIVAGHSPGSKQLPRVPIMVDGQDITYPQCNIAYNKNIFKKVGYLREDMSVAEDCEFHYRCVTNGLTILYHPRMVAVHYERQTKRGWIKKCIKNGFGRYELEKVHPELKHRSQHGLKLKSLIRLGFASIGYLKGKLFGGEIET